MVCKTCEKKLSKVICPDKWKDGARNTMESGGRMLNENKILSKKKQRFNPYGSRCQICKQTMHQEGMFCHTCAYAQGLCSMCGKQVMDITPYAMSEGGSYHNAKRKQKQEKRAKDDDLAQSNTKVDSNTTATEAVDRQNGHERGEEKAIANYQNNANAKDYSRNNRASSHASTVSSQVPPNNMSGNSGPSSAASAAVAMMAAFKGDKTRESFGEGGQQSPGWQFDHRSGYYFDKASGFFFDPKTKLYFDPRVQKWVQGQTQSESSIVTAAS